MRGAAHLCPLLAADGVNPDASSGPSGATVGSVAIDPRDLSEAPSEDEVVRLAALLQSVNSDLVPHSDLKKLSNAEESLAILPQWAQSVVRLGGNAVTNDHKRGSIHREEAPPRKKPRAFQKRSTLHIAANGLNDNEVEQVASSQDTEAGDEDDEGPLRSTFTQEERVADHVDKYSATLAQLVETVQQRRDEMASAGGELGEVDVFKPQEVMTLVQALKVMDKTGLIAKCDPELLLQLQSALDRQVHTGLSLDVLGTMSLDQGDDECQSSGIDLRLIARLQSSLDVGVCELLIMSTCDIDRRILSEDSIDNCFQLLSHAIRRLILPCIDPSSSIAATSASSRTSMDGSSTSTHTDSTNGSGSSRVRSGARRLNVKHNKNTRRAMDRLLPVACEFMEHLARLILTVKLADRWILQFSSMMMKLFLLEFSNYAAQLQRSSSLVLRAIFLRYEAHRSLILDELVAVMIQLPTAKRNLRTVKLVGSTTLVQMITTLAVILVQVSAVSPGSEGQSANSRQDPTLLSEDVRMDEDDEKQGTVAPVNDNDSMQRIAHARSSARTFVTALIRECMKKTEERDNRVVLENCLEDLLAMFGRPEWAGSEIVLEVLSTSLAGILHTNLTKDAKKLESQYSLTALNLVGRICASIRMNQNMVKRDALDDEDTRAICDEHESYLRDVLNNLSEVNGDRNDVGEVVEKDTVLKHIVLTYLRRNVRDVLFEDSRRLLVSHFVLEKTRGRNAYMTSVWKSYWQTKATSSIDSLSKLVCPEVDFALRASVHIAMLGEFGKMFDTLINHLMALLSRGNPTFRARVMKALSGIVDVDPMLMAESAVQSAVLLCFNDEATSVRQAAVDLVGKYVTLQPLLLDRYFEMLCERLRDRGISVRKSVCKILRAYLTLPSHSLSVDSSISDNELRRRSACMRHLVQRIGDVTEEDVVKNFIIDTFQESWFGSELSSRQLSGTNGFDDEPNTGSAYDSAPPGWKLVECSEDCGDGESAEDSSFRKDKLFSRPAQFVSPNGEVFSSAEEAWAAYRAPQVTPSSVVKRKRSKNDDTVAVVTTIVEVVQGMATIDWFVSLLKRLLYDDQSKSSAGRRASRDRSDDIGIARSRSEKIVGCLIDCLVKLEEGENIKGVTETDRESQFLSCVKALSAFSEANPLLLSTHLEVLLVYLKGDENFSKPIEARIQSLIVNIVSNEIARSGRVTERIATRLEGDLKVLIFRAPPSVVGPSIKCLATMSTHAKRRPTLLLNLLGQFFKFLDQFQGVKTLANIKADALASLQRALFAVGQIGSSLDFDSSNFDVPKWTDAPLHKLAKGSIMDALYEVYSAYLKMQGNAATTAKAVQGLGFLFMVRPRFLMQAQQEGQFDALLRSQFHEVRLQILMSLRELLQHEEQRLEEGTSRKKTTNKGKSKKGQVEGDQDGEGSLIGGVMQVQLDNVLELTLEKNVRIRSEAVSCVAVLLTQGLISPVHCIPNLVALEGDQMVSIRDTAHSQLVTLHEKFPTTLHQPAVDGVLMSHTFQVNVFGSSTVYALDKERKEYPLFGRLYTTCLRPGRTQRNIFLRAILGAMTNQFSDKAIRTRTDSQSKPLKTIDFLIYLTKFVTSLPFDVEDEPLFIIYHINRYATLKLWPIIQDIKKAFTSLGLDTINPKQDDADLSNIDIAPLLKLEHENERLEQLTAQCCEGFALHLLLRIKFHLKEVYGLDNEKCQTYQPGRATKATDQSLFISDPCATKLELSFHDDLKADHPLELSWKLLLRTCRAALDDQHQLDFEVHEGSTRTKKKKVVRRRKVVNKATNVEDDDDEYVEGFDG